MIRAAARPMPPPTPPALAQSAAMRYHRPWTTQWGPITTRRLRMPSWRSDRNTVVQNRDRKEADLRAEYST
jgi:hypothetical protein